MSAVRLIRRIPWFDNLLSTQISFALGALCVFVPMWSALMAQRAHLKRFESLEAHRAQAARMHVESNVGAVEP